MDWVLSNLSVEILGTLLIAVSIFVWRWMARTSRRLINRPLLIFVSTGGTCRDPMAKVIVEQLFKDAPRPIEVEAVGVGDITSDHASKPAQHVIQELYGANLLAKHKPGKFSKELAKRATLILCMTQAHVDTIKKIYPAAYSKVHPLKAYFGVAGEVEDPYRAPDEMTADALARYRRCAKELHDILLANRDHLLAALT